MSTIRTNTLSNVAGTQSTAIENAINGSAKAWVNFNGTGTVAIRASYNVSSITDNGTGDYTLNFTTALVDSNYSVIGVGSNSGLDYRATISPRVNSGTAPSTFLTTTSVRVSAVGLSSTITDVETGCVSINR